MTPVTFRQHTEPTPLWTARQVGEHLGLEAATVTAWVREGKLPAFRLPSGQLRFRSSEVEAWLAERAVGER
jgi:excisionase family DNA binding protein